MPLPVPRGNRPWVRPSQSVPSQVEQTREAGRDDGRRIGRRFDTAARFWIDEIREVGVHLMGRRLYEMML
jgi:hypothetical protein